MGLALKGLKAKLNCDVKNVNGNWFRRINLKIPLF